MNKNTVDHFWKWFTLNQHEYLPGYKMKKKREQNYWRDEMDSHIKACCRFFSFFIALLPQGNMKLIISTDGRKKYFSKVDKLMARAPNLPDWEFSALADSSEIGFILDEEISKSGIDPSEFRFMVAGEKPEGKELCVFHPLFTVEKEIDFMILARLTVFNLLGERTFSNEIYQMRVFNKSQANGRTHYPLSQLPLHLGVEKSNIMIDEKGNILM